MAYGVAPWEVEEWPTVWVARSLAELEPVEAPPEFGQLSGGAQGQPELGSG